MANTSFSWWRKTFVTGSNNLNFRLFCGTLDSSFLQPVHRRVLYVIIVQKVIHVLLDYSGEELESTALCKGIVMAMGLQG